MEQARCHPKVQALLRIRECYKRRLKSRAGTIEGCKGSRLYEEYCKIKRAYISEFEFQKKTLLGEVKKKFHEEQPVVDILHQIHGLDLQDAKGDVVDLSSLSFERTRVMNALITITPPEVNKERCRRIEAIEAMVALGRVQDGHQFPVRARDVHKRSMEAINSLPNACKQTQCFLCFGNADGPSHRRSKGFHTKGDLKKHLLRFHARHMREGQHVRCPIDGMILQDGQHILMHAHEVHGTPVAC